MIVHYSGRLPTVLSAAFARLKKLGANKKATRKVADNSAAKVEYVDEMTHLRERHIECRSEFLTQLERGLRQAGKQGLLAADVNPRYAAVGLHALVDSLIMNWVLDPKYFPLARAAGPMIKRYIDSLKSNKAQPTSSKVAKRRSVK